MERKPQEPPCLVLMPSGQKADDTGRLIDFDDIYRSLVGPAARASGLAPWRVPNNASDFGDQSIFNQLMICDYVLADLTFASPKVYYELGVRRGSRPASTVLIMPAGIRSPFDPETDHVVRYVLDETGKLSETARDRIAISARLSDFDHFDECSFFQLVNPWPRPDVARLKTDMFRQLASYDSDLKHKLANAREAGKNSVVQLHKIETELGESPHNPALLIDLMLSYRAISAFEDMVRLVEKMPAYLARTVLVREQYGFAFNRLGQRQKAEEVLRAVIAEHGPNSETNGLLGRVYKDRWDDALKGGDAASATAYLKEAIACYLEGFEADWRDAYPGINAVTLMELIDPPDPRQKQLLSVVEYAIKRRLAGGRSDYWDYAAMLELCVLMRRKADALEQVGRALTVIREPWEAKTTARQLTMILDARKRRGETSAWLAEIIAKLKDAA